ncbi:MAG TPA: glycosyltransferase [Candidatus Eremiobacteraeota bacterium]|nr:MAG: Chondroitin synthase [bacterium ADurb.Bin363]HPZ08857.1 glycosyltransferase [Candidatus Eremiobacteraeota bacterium]
MQYFISVIIPTFNRKETLKPVLESLNRQTFPDSKYEIVIVDSNSTDGTSEMIKELQLKPSLRYIRQENRGRSGARNRGIKEAEGHIILFTDADIIASPELLKEHEIIHCKHPGEAVVGLEVQVSSIEEYEHVRDHPENRKELHPKSRKKLSWLYFMTGNASVSRDKLIEVGMFDEDFQGYGWEDIELGYRLAKSGISINYRRNAVNYHLHPASLEEKYKIMRMAGVSAVKFYRKHKDWKIRYLLGMNPLSLKIHSFISPEGWVIKKCREQSESQSLFRGFCRDILLQYHYLNGVKEEFERIN